MLGPARRRTTPQTVEVDGLDYREGLNAVGIRGGVAGNVIPDECVVTVNYRFAPDRIGGARREAHVREVFDGYDVDGHRRARRARGPGWTVPAAKAFVEARRRRRSSRSSAGPTWPGSPRSAIPAVNFGPGDPNLAHNARSEHVPVEQIGRREAALLRWLG